MNDAAKSGTILLATGLSHRCDRAFARAWLLARQWRARLLDAAREGTVTDAIVETGAAADVVLEAARASGARLVVTG